MQRPPELSLPTPCPAALNQAPEPVFNAPWEATAFAIVNQLATLEHCTWSEWTQYLASAIAATAKAAPGSMTYYEQWVLACEKLLADKGLLDAQAIDHKIQELVAVQATEHRH